MNWFVSIVQAWHGAAMYMFSGHAYRLCRLSISYGYASLRTVVHVMAGLLLVDGVFGYWYRREFAAFVFESSGSQLVALGMVFLWQLQMLIAIAGIVSVTSTRCTTSLWQNLLRVLQWCMIFYLVRCMLTLLLFICGISMVPLLPVTIASLIMILLYTALLYWMDGMSTSLLVWFRSFERACNLLFYNMPIYLILGGMHAVIVWGMRIVMPYIIAHYDMGAPAWHGIGAYSFYFLCKVGFFVLALIPIVLLCVFYQEKKDEQYAPPFL